MSTEINEADSYHSETILSDHGNETIINKIDSLENKIKQITDINQQFQIETDKLKSRS